MNPDSRKDFDQYQKVWKTHSSQTRVTINADRLQKEAQREQRTSRVMSFWRDCGDIGIALLMLPMWFYLGVTWSLPWTWYLTVPALAWVAGFILVNRMRYQPESSGLGEPLLHSVKDSLTEVEHRIWLLRNIFWWYLLPLTISLPVFFAQVNWLRSGNWWESLGSTLLVAALYAVIYFLNQLAVSRQLEPRRRELLTLLTSLRDENEIENGKPLVTRRLESARRPREVWRPFVLGSVCGVVITWIALTGGVFDSGNHIASGSNITAGASLAGLVTDLR